MCGCCGCCGCGVVKLGFWFGTCGDFVGGLNTLISTAISDGKGYGDIEDDFMGGIDVVVPGCNRLMWWSWTVIVAYPPMRNPKSGTSSLVVRSSFDSFAEVRCCRLCEAMNALWSMDSG